MIACLTINFTRQNLDTADKTYTLFKQKLNIDDNKNQFNFSLSTLEKARMGGRPN